MNDAVASENIDPIDRLAILAGALPGAVVRQRQITAPFDAVWRVIADLEQATPRYEPNVAHLRVIEQHGQLLRVLVEDATGHEEMMDAKLRPGWCLMQSATVVVAFAARPVGSQTLLAHLEHRRVQTPQLSQSGSHGRLAAEAKIDQELETIERLAAQGGQ